jgi:hypothetical protein
VQALTDKTVNPISPLPQREATLLGSIINMANTVLGAGLLGLPYAFANAGWVFGTLFLVIRDSFSKFLLMVWACSVCGIYRLGLNWLSPHWVKQGDVCPIERLSAGQLGINPKPFSLLWGVILVGMVVGALLVLLFERRQRKQREEAEFMENWRKTHNDGSQFPWAG